MAVRSLCWRNFRGASVLLAADAHPQVLHKAIKALLAERHENKLRIDAFKVSHHGSRGNTTVDLLNLLDCNRFLISTDGSYFQHPDDETMARLILSASPGAEFYFNYRPQTPRLWDDSAVQKEYGFRISYPNPTQAP